MSECDLLCPRCGADLHIALIPRPGASPRVTASGGTKSTPTLERLQLWELTDRQRLVCEMFREGQSPRAVARKLRIAVSTVRTHLVRAAQTLGMEPGKLVEMLRERD